MGEHVWAVQQRAARMSSSIGKLKLEKGPGQPHRTGLGQMGGGHWNCVRPESSAEKAKGKELNSNVRYYSVTWRVFILLYKAV